MSLCSYAEDTEAVFVVVESDALDDAEDADRHGCSMPRILGRLLYLYAKLDYFPALFGGDPNRPFSEGVRYVELDYLCHNHSPFFQTPPRRCPGLQPDCRITRKQVRSHVLCATFVTAMQSKRRLGKPLSSPYGPYHSHPHIQRTESHNRSFFISALHPAHDLIHIGAFSMMTRIGLTRCNRSPASHGSRFAPVCSASRFCHRRY
jgi:hypothetical protein